MGRLSGNENLKLYVANIAGFTKALIKLAELAPERSTMAQLTFFLLAADFDLRGLNPTFTNIRDAAGPVVNRSLHTTYKIFLDRPVKRHGDGPDRSGLGWLTREENPRDNREKFLKLTPKGLKVISDLISILKE